MTLTLRDVTQGGSGGRGGAGGGGLGGHSIGIAYSGEAPLENGAIDITTAAEGGNGGPGGDGGPGNMGGPGDPGVATLRQDL